MEQSKLNYINVEDDLKKFFADCIDFDTWTIKKNFLLCMNSLRNKGKSYSAWNVAGKLSLKPNMQLAYLRNSQNEIDNFKSNVKNINPKLSIIRDRIVENHYELQEIKGEEKMVKIGEDTLGNVFALSTAYNYKSAAFPYTNLIVYDEYDDVGVIKNIYTTFTNLICTIQRNRTMGIIMLGNKMNSNNEFMVKWEIEPRPKDFNPQDDYIVDFTPEGSDTKMIYIDKGDNYITTTGTTTWETLASFDANLNSFFNNNTYINDKSHLVKPFKKYIQKTFKPLKCLIIDNIKYVLGTFIFEEDKKWCLVEGYNIVETETLPKTSLDFVSYSNDKDSDILDKEEVNDLINDIINNMKQENLYYSSFDIKNVFEEYINCFMMNKKIYF